MDKEGIDVDKKGAEVDKDRAEVDKEGTEVDKERAYVNINRRDRIQLQLLRRKLSRADDTIDSKDETRLWNLRIKEKGEKLIVWSSTRLS